MNIDKIKNQIIKLRDKRLKVKINIGRNKHEYYDGYIKEIYPNLFTIETSKGIKSFTYSDVVTKVIILSVFE